MDKNIPDTLSQPQLLAFHKIKDLSPERFLSDLVSVPADDQDFIEPTVCRVISAEPELQVNHPEKDWMEIINIPGVGTSPGQGMLSAFSVLTEKLKECGTTTSCLSRIVLYIVSMSDYAELNKIYLEQFSVNPPVRVCVAVGAENLPKGVVASFSTQL